MMVRQSWVSRRGGVSMPPSKRDFHTFGKARSTRSQINRKVGSVFGSGVRRPAMPSRSAYVSDCEFVVEDTSGSCVSRPFAGTRDVLGSRPHVRHGEVPSSSPGVGDERCPENGARILGDSHLRAGSALRGNSWRMHVPRSVGSGRESLSPAVGRVACDID